MDNTLELLQKHISEHQPSFGDGDSVLTLLYEVYSECNRLDDAQVKADFEDLYCLINGMLLREMDQIIYLACKLCRDHENAGFIEGVIIGLRLHQELLR